jgi:hypothetical protein
MAAIFDYLLDTQISRQWRGLLAALADEFEAQIGRNELRQLMHRVGSRFAQAHPLPARSPTPSTRSGATPTGASSNSRTNAIT